MSTTAKVAKLPNCNFDCEEKAQYDFRTMTGQWAYGCKGHWVLARMHTDLGTGKGQELILDA